MSGCCARCARPASSSRAPASTIPRSIEELPRHVAALRASGAAVVHLSPHAQGAPEISVDNRGRHRVDGRGARRAGPSDGSRSWPVRIRCTSRASAWRAIARGTGRRGHRRRRAADRPRPASPRGGRTRAWTTCSPRTCEPGTDSRRSVRQRPARARRPRSASTSSASTSRPTSPSPASTTSLSRQ